MRVLFAAVLALLVTAGSEAQTDPAQALIGKWQGDVQHQAAMGNPNPNRILVIESVRQQDGKWIADGRFGVTKPSGKVSIDVDLSGRWPSIRFVTGGNATVKLNLLDAKSMAGTITFAGTSQRGNERPMRLEKVE